MLPSFPIMIAGYVMSNSRPHKSHFMPDDAQIVNRFLPGLILALRTPPASTSPDFFRNLISGSLAKRCSRRLQRYAIEDTLIFWDMMKYFEVQCNLFTALPMMQRRNMKKLKHLPVWCRLPYKYLQVLPDRYKTHSERRS